MEHNNSVKSLENKMSFEEKWGIIQEEGINKIIDSFKTGVLLTPGQYMRMYNIVFNICVRDTNTREDAQTLYNNYKKTFENYISAKVLPSLRGKTNEVLLQELVKQWNNLKRLTECLSKFFKYLDRYYIPRRNLPSLKGTSYSIFYELVYGEFSDQIRVGVLYLIKKDREGVDIDKALVKNVLDIYIEMGEGSPKYFQKDFGKSILDDDTTSTGSSESSDDAPMMSVTNYILKKVKECSNQKKDQIPEYLRNTNGDRTPEYPINIKFNIKFKEVEAVIIDKLILDKRNNQNATESSRLDIVEDEEEKELGGSNFVCRDCSSKEH